MQKLFKEISTKEQKKLLKLLETSILYFKKNSTILSGTNNNIIGIILQGEAQIIKTDYNGNRTIIEELKQESIFGTLISSLSSEECEIITKKDTKVLVIDYDIILKSKNINFSYYNQFIKNLLEITTNIIEEKNNRIEILTKKTIRDKLLEYFKIYSGSNVIYLPFSFTDLASFLAVDRSAMTRELKNLKEEGFISINGRKINLLYR